MKMVFKSINLYSYQVKKKMSNELALTYFFNFYSNCIQRSNSDDENDSDTTESVHSPKSPEVAEVPKVPEQSSSSAPGNYQVLIKHQ